MFSKTEKGALDTQQISTLISEGCIIDGNIKAPAFIRIDGQVNGNVIVDGGLILGEKGLITGDVVTKEMIVYGKVNGKPGDFCPGNQSFGPGCWRNKNKNTGGRAWCRLQWQTADGY